MSAGDIFLGLLAIVFPPIAVWVKSGICSCDSLINILLCMLGFLPGLIHAWYIISIYPEPEYDYEPIGDAERGSSTHYYRIGHSSPGPQQPGGQGQRGYGTSTTAAANGQAREGGHNQTSTAAPSVPNDTRPAQPSINTEGNAEGSASRPPPSYAEAVKGDHKIQTHD